VPATGGRVTLGWKGLKGLMSNDPAPALPSAIALATVNVAPAMGALSHPLPCKEIGRVSISNVPSAPTTKVTFVVMPSPLTTFSVCPLPDSSTSTPGCVTNPCIHTAVSDTLMSLPSAIWKMPGVVKVLACAIASVSSPTLLTVTLWTTFAILLPLIRVSALRRARLRGRFLPPGQRTGVFEFGDQRREPCRIGPPAAEPARVHGLAHLGA
jgi:hypothetical protein